LFLAPSLCHGQSNFDFRYVCWGSSKAEVKATENDKKIKYDDEDLFVVRDVLNGIDCDVVYIFVDDKLVRTKYVVTEKYSNLNTYIYKYNEFYKLLSEKYGDGKKSSIISDHYKRKNSDLGIGIGMGEVHFFSEWKTPKTNISMILTGNNFDVTLAIEYQSVALAQLDNEKQKKKLLKNL